MNIWVFQKSYVNYFPLNHRIPLLSSIRLKVCKGGEHLGEERFGEADCALDINRSLFENLSRWGWLLVSLFLVVDDSEGWSLPTRLDPKEASGLASEFVTGNIREADANHS